MNLYDGLVRYKDGTLEVEPALATSWNISNDGTEYTFSLRQGVKFHDGSDFNADDVLFTAQRAQNVPKSPSGFGTYLKGKEFIKIDSHTIHIKTKKPYPLMPNDIMTVKIIYKEKWRRRNHS